MIGVAVRYYRFLSRLHWNSIIARNGIYFVYFGTTLIALYTLFWFSVTLPYWFSELSDDGETRTWPGYKWAIISTIFGLWLLINALFHYFSAVLTEPGYTTNLTGLTKLSEDGHTEVPRFPLCEKCDHAKPERAHHCSYCNKCVLKLDHHCPWINNCVGNNNHRSFVLCLYFIPMGSTYFFVMNIGIVWAILVSGKDFVWESWFIEYAFIATVLVAAPITWALAGLTTFQTFLVITGQTSIEEKINAKKKMQAAMQGEKYSNPYNLGVLSNILVFFHISDTYPIWLLGMPVNVPPRTDGTTFFMDDGEGPGDYFSEDN